jgi:hypothetical protein
MKTTYATTRVTTVTRQTGPDTRPAPAAPAKAAPVAASRSPAPTTPKSSKAPAQPALRAAAVFEIIYPESVLPPETPVLIDGLLPLSLARQFAALVALHNAQA